MSAPVTTSGTHIPVEIMSSEQFTQIQPGSLFQEFCLGRMRSVVIEGNKHRTG
jgi:hypothetical protein